MAVPTKGMLFAIYVPASIVLAKTVELTFVTKSTFSVKLFYLPFSDSLIIPVDIFL